ncbi:MAG TPA: hypothetical protein P5560_11990 [Thermotogota bacterium]|nr:hypothetical protein [Thermotogota bacterium]
MAFYFAYDVSSIKKFLFDSLEFKAIVGASQLVKQFDQSMKEVLSSSQWEKLGKCVFTGGGTGFFEFREKPDQLQEFLEGEVEKKRQEFLLGHPVAWVFEEIGSLSFPALPPWFQLDSVGGTGEYARLFSRIAISLNRKKQQELEIDESPGWVDASELCPSCGTRRRLGDQDGFCPVCLQKVQQGEAYFSRLNQMYPSCTFTFDLNAISGKEQDQEVGELGVLYGDGNSMGDIYKGFQSGEAFSSFSEELEGSIQEAVFSALQSQGVKKAAIPILGGDDMMIILPRKDLFPVLDRLDVSLSQKKVQGHKVTYSFGAAVVPTTLPFYLIFQIVENELLPEAKTARQKSGKVDQNFISFRYIKATMIEGKREKVFPGEAGYQVSLPFHRGMDFPEFRKMVKMVKSASQMDLRKTTLQKLWESLSLGAYPALLNSFYFLKRNSKLDEQTQKDFLENVYLPGFSLQGGAGKAMESRFGTFMELYDLLGGEKAGGGA